MAESEIYLNVAAVARLLGVKTSRAYQLANAGEIPTVRRGRRILIPRTAFQSWLDAEAERALARVRGAAAVGPR